MPIYKIAWKDSHHDFSQFDLSGQNDVEQVSQQYLEKSSKLNLATAEGNKDLATRNEIKSVFDELSAQFSQGSQDENSLFSQLLDEHHRRRVSHRYEWECEWEMQSIR